MLTFTCRRSAPHCMWGRKTWREKCRCRNSHIPITWFLWIFFQKVQRRIFTVRVVWATQRGFFCLYCHTKQLLLTLPLNANFVVGDVFHCCGYWPNTLTNVGKVMSRGDPVQADSSSKKWNGLGVFLSKGPLSRVTIFQTLNTLGKRRTASPPRYKTCLVLRSFCAWTTEII